MKKTINCLLVGVSAMAMLTMGGCSKSSSLPPIGGYNTANDVAAANLLAHWTFDNTNNEIISGTAPTTATGNSFVTGQVGQALNLSAGYLLYPTIGALSSATAIPSVSVSLWVKINNNGTEQTNLFGITQSASVQSDWNTGPVNVYVETGNHKATSDTLQVHSDFATYIGGTRYNGDNVNNYGGVAGTDYQYVTQGGKWMHYVMEYDGVGSNIDIYINGVIVSDDQFRNRTYTPQGSTTAVGLGVITVTPPTQVIIGGWPNSSTGFANSATQTWQGLMTGSLDEVRVYSKALTATEIGALYSFGQAGR
jgi:hypothetical protein